MFQKIKQFIVDVNSGDLYKKSSNITMRLNAKHEQFLYILLLAIFLVHYEMQTIMYPADWPVFNYIYLRTFLCMFLFVKYAFGEKKHFGVSETILAIMISFSFFMAYQYAGYAKLFDTALLILCAKDISYRSVIKTYISVKLPMILLTIILSQTGLVENLIYDQHGRIREAFGFVYPTDFAAQIFFLFAAWACLRELRITYLELAGMVVSAFLLKYFCDPRCSVICIILLVLWMVFQKNKKYIPKKLRYSKLLHGIFKWGCLAVPYCFAGFMILVSRFYNPENAVLSFLNSLVNGRLALGYEGFVNYDSTWYGQYIEMIGNGGTTEKVVGYNFIDCSYLNIWLCFGSVIFVTVLVLLSYLTIKNWKHTLLLGIIILICLHSVIEHHLIEFHYNFMMLLPFTSWNMSNEIKKNKDS